jgi:uncharacterized Tic20 family protein
LNTGREYYGHPGEQARQTAMVVHLLALLTGFLGPLIIYLVKKDEDEFVRFHALQALYFELVAIPLALITCGIWGIVVIVYNIIACMRANEGEWYELPIVGSWARE